MRPSLLPGLIAAARRNMDRGASSVRLFEIGRRYLGDAEHPTLGAAARRRATAARLAGGQGASVRRVRRQGRGAGAARCGGRAGRQSAGHPDAGPTWHPGRSAKLGLGPKTIVAAFGELHPSLRKSLDAPAGAVAAEIYLDAIPAPRSSGHARSAICAACAAGGHARFRLHRPGRTCPPTICCARSAAPTRRRSPPSGCSTGSRRPTGCRLAFEVTLQPVEKSFTDEQIGEISQRIVAAAEKLGARLRS